MRRGSTILLTFALIAAALPPLAASAAPTLPPSIELPRWAIGFHWTYHFEGPTDQSFAGYQATYINDTYTAEVIAAANTPRGDAWVVRNFHDGTLQGHSGPFPITGTFTSLTYYYFRQSDYAILNFTQDLNITARIPFSGTITGSAHNESTAEPPFAQIAYGSTTNGTPWRVFSNVTSVGWYTFASSPPINTSSWVLLDYNLSVEDTANVSVPAGVLPSYNISGNGTYNFNGTQSNLSLQFFYAPPAMSDSVDEAGYLLMSFYVNRPPRASGLPALVVPAGGAASIDLTAYISDPEGDPFTISCSPAPPLGCSVAPNGTLTVTAAPGTNATLQLALLADDGFPGGNATFLLTVVSSGPGNPNQPPVLVGGTTLTTPEDTPYTFLLPTHVSDPDDANLTWSLTVGDNATLTAEGTNYFTLSTPANFTGYAFFNVTVYDGAGNFAAFAFALAVLPVNDPPEISTASPRDLLVHEFDTLDLSVAVTDVEGDPVTVAWDIDGAPVGTGTTLSLTITGLAPGLHNLTATATDAQGASSALTFRLTVLAGPVILSASPSTPLHIVAGYALAFAVNVSDPDSTFLEFTWERDGIVFANGGGIETANLSFPSPGTFSVRVNVTDGGSYAAHLWAINVEAMPGGLVSISTPAQGATFEANASVNLTASIDPRLTNVTFNWTLNGNALPIGFHVVTSPLAPGEYTAVLKVDALFNASLPYSGVSTVNFTINAPSPPPPPPPPGTNQTGQTPSGSEFPILALAAVLAAAALAGSLMVRRRKGAVPPEPPQT
jgi:hypothetical protein